METKALEELRISKDLKYVALYWALGFNEVEEGLFVKSYGSCKIKILADERKAILSSNISILHGSYLPLEKHGDFVILECLDYLLSNGYKPEEIIVDLDNEYDIYCKNIYFKCKEWEVNFDESQYIKPKENTYIAVYYRSRLISGMIDRSYIAFNGDGIAYNAGIEKHKLIQISNTPVESKDFEIKGNKITKYLGHNKKVVIPEGIVELDSCLFWDNQEIEEVMFPESLRILGGDTFYKCEHLRHIVITKNIEKMGNNPFAGCPNLTLENESPSYDLIDGVFFDKKRTLIYFPIKSDLKKYIIPEGTKVIGKHSFYMCSNLEEIVIPSTILHMENNPFSSCSRLKISNNRSSYKICDGVIYNPFGTEIIGVLETTRTDCLIIKEGTKSINRNSFYNCHGIKKVILPSSLERIGYNPFVGCSNIEFESKTDKFHISDGVLYSADYSKLICYPSKLCYGDIHLRDEVRTLERGAFSGCEGMVSISLKNVTTIGKSCFTNCNRLKEIYCSDLVKYIGEWAFAHCSQLQRISVSNECFIDRNAFLNTSVAIKRRSEKENYLIESDNLYSLMSLNEIYEGKVDSILIDPPYNSHIDYIEYQDENFDGGYLSFMKSRILLAYKLLSDKGFMIVNIDEGGKEDIVSICKSVFGRRNVKIHRWTKLDKYFDQNKEIKKGKKVVKDEFVIVCKKSSQAILKNIMQPYFENGVYKEREAEFPYCFVHFGTTSSAKDELASLFGSRSYFSTPKPVKLIKEFVRATTDKDSIVLDFFAGSGTTGQAVDELNKEDGGRRTFILVSNAESNICQNVTKKRLEMVGTEFVFLS